jgi:hypothetical protein
MQDTEFKRLLVAVATGEISQATWHAVYQRMLGNGDLERCERRTPGFKAFIEAQAGVGAPHAILHKGPRAALKAFAALTPTQRVELKRADRRCFDALEQASQSLLSAGVDLSAL